MVSPIAVLMCVSSIIGMGSAQLTPETKWGKHSSTVTLPGPTQHLEEGVIHCGGRETRR